MEQHTDNQYDDDLTVGIEDLDEDSLDTGFVDLFEFSGEEESPISRLKTIVLSIDWEITDEVLTQFNDELLDLKDIWADDPIKMVYVQALEKLSKYIYQQKSDSHPNAIKLLLTFYYNLEKIVLDTDLKESEKKEILSSDVRKFEQLKTKIDLNKPGRGRDEGKKPAIPPASISEDANTHPVLFNLKACILGMDWEITERELGDLSREIMRLEEEFAGNKPRMLFLQGIEALGGYIKLKKSDAHADAFKLLYSFYEGLEKIVINEMSFEEQKAVLLPEVEKFEEFKNVIAPTLAVGTPADGGDSGQTDELEYDDSEVAPAFADMPDDVQGFQAEQEAAGLGEDLPDDVEGRLDSFFTDEAAPAGASGDTGQEKPEEPEEPEEFTQEALDKVTSFFAAEEEQTATDFAAISAEDALRGVDVETEADDDSDEEALPTAPDGMLAPALADSAEEGGFAPDEADIAAAVPTEEQAPAEIEDRLGSFFDEEDESPAAGVAAEAALAGVDVETEADDDSDEAPLALTDDDLAPALSMDDAEDSQQEETEEEPGELAAQIDGFFGEEESASAGAALSGVDTEDDEDFDEPGVLAGDSDLAPALFGADDDEEESDDSAAELPEDIESRLDSFFGDEEDAGEEDTFRAAPEAEEDDGGAEELVFEADTEEPDDRAADELPVDELPGDELPVDELPVDEIPADDQPAAEPAPAFSFSEEDTVAFEPVADDEAAMLEEDSVPEALIEEDDEPQEDSFSTFQSESDEDEFFAAIDERVDEPGEFQMELLDEKDEFSETDISTEPGVEDDFAAVPGMFDDEAEAETAAAEETAEEDLEEDEEYVFTSDDNLADLRAGIASLGVEISVPITEAILSTVNGLRHQYMTRPIDKTFLQLISTIVQHIGQYRYEASAEAHGLLLSVFDKLEIVQDPETDAAKAQEILLAETSKVLLWQQKMLDRQAIRKGDQLTFIDPVRSDVTEEKDKELVAEELLKHEDGDAPEAAEGGEQEDFSAVFEPVEDETLEEDSFESAESFAVETADTADTADTAETSSEELSFDETEAETVDEALSFEGLDAGDNIEDERFDGDELEDETPEDTDENEEELFFSAEEFEDDFITPEDTDAEGSAEEDSESYSGELHDDFLALSDDHDEPATAAEKAEEEGTDIKSESLESVADYVKKEIEALRMSLQAEIEDLKNKLQDRQ